MSNRKPRESRSTSKNDRLARDLFGSDVYDAVPKSVFAAIAWHLANQTSTANSDDWDAAMERFYAEWDALLPHGLSKPAGHAKQFSAKGRACDQG